MEYDGLAMETPAPDEPPFGDHRDRRPALYGSPVLATVAFS